LLRPVTVHPCAALVEYYPENRLIQIGWIPRLRVYRARSPVLSHRIEFRFRLSLSPVLADWPFASSCSPRSDYAAAVTFHYRSSDLGPDGDFHPATLCALTVALGRPWRDWDGGRLVIMLGKRTAPVTGFGRGDLFRADWIDRGRELQPARAQGQLLRAVKAQDT